MSKSYQAIILMGIQGSGKGTQGQLMEERLGFEFIETGGIFREEAKSGSALGRKIDEIVNAKGELVPDNITKKLFEKKIKDVPINKTIIIDGYPRTMQQYHDLIEILEKYNRSEIIVFNVLIPDELALERISSRSICQECKAIHKDPKIEKCQKCGGKLTKREDDTPEKVKKRLLWSHQETDPVIEAFRSKGSVIDINGRQSIEKVYKDIEKNLE